MEGNLTRRQWALRALGVAGTAALASFVGMKAVATLEAEDAKGEEELLETIRARHDVPALAAAAIKDGKTVTVEAVGVRKRGDPTPVTPEDQFHLGSCTKSMTATLVGMLVEEGKLTWETTLARALPDLKDTMHPGLRDLTLEMLLSHRSGLSGRGTPLGNSLMDMHRLPGTPREQRRAYLERIVRDAPLHPPRAKYVYSNAGFAIAGAIIERVTDSDWETVMRRRLFEPLGMKTAGFGAMGRPGKIEQPWQHRGEGAECEPVEPGQRSDNPPVIGPAGTVHASLGDWAKYILPHVREGRSGLLRPETFRKLHTPPFGGDYAFGWVTAERGWGGGRVLWHNGSNTMNYAVVWFAPLKDFAALAATNQAGDAGSKACDDAVGLMITRYLTG